MAQFVLSVRDVPEGESRYQFDVTPTWLTSQIDGCKGLFAGEKVGELGILVHRRGKQLVVQGRAVATIRAECVRCLELFEVPIDTEVQVVFKPGPPRAVGSKELTSEDLGEERYQGETIELDELVRDLLLLEVPMNPVCGDTCPGWSHLLSTG